MEHEAKRGMIDHGDQTRMSFASGRLHALASLRPLAAIDEGVLGDGGGDAYLWADSHLRLGSERVYEWDEGEGEALRARPTRNRPSGPSLLSLLDDSLAPRHRR